MRIPLPFYFSSELSFLSPSLPLIAFSVPPVRTLDSLIFLIRMGEPHVQGILLAEFDIDKGASLTYQYPKPTGTDEQ